MRHLRLHGALRGMVATDGTSAEQLIHEAKQLPSMAGQELASRVSTETGYKWDTGSIELASSPWSSRWARPAPGNEGGRKLRVAAYDFGIKQNILRLLIDHGCEVVVVPAQTPADDVLSLQARTAFFVQRTGRSRAGDIRDRKYSPVARQGSGVWNLPGASALRTRAGREDFQAQVRASRLESSGEKSCSRNKWRSLRRITGFASIQNRCHRATSR